MLWYGGAARSCHTLRCLRLLCRNSYRASCCLRLRSSPRQGDNDPVDVVEIGSATLEMGGVYEARPLCCATLQTRERTSILPVTHADRSA